jgi:ABC-2 type transport system ATP-binding protein
MVLGHGQKLYDGDLPALLEKYDTSRTVTVRFEDPQTVPTLPEEATLSREGDLVKVVYAPGRIPTPEILEKLQQAGTIREMTIQPQNIDVLIAAMYREMDL